MGRYIGRYIGRYREIQGGRAEVAALLLIGVVEHDRGRRACLG